ncbi:MULTISPECIES: ABC transporter substrate-binding protein [unclassified Sinorhizobium]|uniref:ABC transporter substrate-binding protein n=1 Tax=unclassified Sinorhizobium TaxID=2613772 RepID=UPI0024C33BE8|nr:MULTISPECIES: ABC transporter substrate-binding protein [unclassified Sinorhizobium]MDK1373589.1 ABC transporter substrate-binding protein [Sinorhizobium sp. 6-70]MDK1480200.1 ABC transporter substrate-binding protein [Sinorhizobium sp. 6-117]
MRRRWYAIILAAAAARAFVAFAPTASADAMDELVAAAKKEGQLTVIALPRDWCEYGDIIDGFAAKYGLSVNELQPDAPSAKEIEAITTQPGKAGAEMPDVIDIGLAFAPAAKSEGLLQPYKVSTWDTIPEAAKDADGYWYGDYYGVLAFEVNANLVAKLPKDWSDLLAPEYRNAVGLAGDIFSNQAIQGVFAAGLSAANGNREEAANQGLKFFANLHGKGNFVPIVGDYRSLADGRTPILIRWDYLARGDRDRLAGKTKVEIVKPKTGAVAGIYVQAISARALHPHAARLWMEYLYSDEAQLAFLKGHCSPIRLADLVRNEKVPAELRNRLPPFEGGVGYADPAFPSAEEQKRARQIIMDGWDSVVGTKIECRQPEESFGPMSSNDSRLCPAPVPQ